MKIFQIGFNRCGTLSLHYFFEKNGLKSIHYDYGHIACEIIKNISVNNDKILGKYEEYDFLCDMEFICNWEHKYRGVNYAFRYFKELDRAYPNSKFILNTRSVIKWVSSRSQHMDGEYLNRYKDIYKMDTLSVHKKWMMDWYRHHYEVIEYFRDRPKDLLVLDLEAGMEHNKKKLDEFFEGRFNVDFFEHTHKRPEKTKKIK
jgi:hypothetical protein